jgi:hypothetical protein
MCLQLFGHAGLFLETILSLPERFAAPAATLVMRHWQKN